MSCSSIPLLLLSDTFNTWFNRTNELITDLNSQKIRDLIPFSTSDDVFQGTATKELANCRFSTEVLLGPFLGYISGGITGLYGEGNLENPQRITVSFPEPNLTEDGATFGLTWGGLSNNDRIMINDISDLEVPVKAIPASTFIPVAGPNIAISRNEFGNFEIQQVNTTFSPNFTANPSFATYEIGHRTRRDSEQITFTITAGGGNVHPVSATITLTTPGHSGQRISGFTPRTIDSFNAAGSSSVNSSTVDLPINPENWFGFRPNLSNNTQVGFSASITSATASSGTPVVPFTQTTANRSGNYTFGWRFYTYSSPTPLTAQQILAARTNNINQFWQNPNEGQQIHSNPRPDRTLTFPIDESPPGEKHVYFIHSSSNIGGTGSAGDSFGWSPQFKAANGDILQNVFEEITENGPIQITDGNKRWYYRIWRSVLRYNPPNITFQVGGNTH